MSFHFFPPNVAFSRRARLRGAFSRALEPCTGTIAAFAGVIRSATTPGYAFFLVLPLLKCPALGSALVRRAACSEVAKRTGTVASIALSQSHHHVAEPPILEFPLFEFIFLWA
jgi:hypothetical protein